MTRRDLLRGACAVPLAVSAAATRRPNVVLLVSDDQGFGDLSLHGNPTLNTPNLDRIAQEGVEFTQFHVNPVCSPTRASLLTGRYCYRTGVVDTYLGRSMMYNDEITLAEVLRASGYTTGIFGKWHLGDHYPMRPTEHGFEECLVHQGGGISQPSDPPEGNSYFNPRLTHNNEPEQRAGYCTDVFFDAAMQFIEANRDRPFFAYVATNAPHVPLQVEESFVKPFREAGVDETTARTYGMVANLDQNVGRLLAHLAKLDLEQDTILVYLSDNGPTPARFNAGMRGIKGTVYEGGIRVPFFLRWPRTVPPGRKVDRIAGHIDLFPTLIEACEARPPADRKIDGMSLLPLIRSHAAQKTWPERTLFFQWHRGDRPEPFKNSAALTGRYKLVDGRELYDLKDDPAESRDISAARPEIVARLREQYSRWFEDVTASRRFEMPRIYIGTPFENPVLLTRQDWRGPLATWEPGGLGFWDVDVRSRGSYECTLLFPPAAVAGEVRVSLGGANVTAPIKQGASSARLSLGNLPRGPVRIEAALITNGPPVGPHYVSVRKLPDA